MMGPKMVWMLRALSAFWISLMVVVGYDVESTGESVGLGYTILTAVLLSLPAVAVLKFVKTAPVDAA